MALWFDSTGPLLFWQRWNTKSLEVDPSKIRRFQQFILNWFEENGREFPWRKNGITLFELIISEILLQRTQAQIVATQYEGFFERFSGWDSLLAFSEKELSYQISTGAATNA